MLFLASKDFLFRGMGWLLLGLLTTVALSGAEEVQNESTTDGVTAETQKVEKKEHDALFMPRSTSDSIFESRKDPSSLAWAFYLFLFMVAILGVLWFYQKKGGVRFSRMGVGGELRLLETKALGNRQYLVVVEYGEQRMLLGVAPGVINHLCYLESSTTNVDSHTEEPQTNQQ